MVHLGSLEEVEKVESAEAQTRAEMRILLVDDDTLLRKALARRLRACGVRVDAASGVHEALAMLACHPYEMVISDENMADGRGHELLASISQRQPACRRVLMSALDVPEGVTVVWERFFTKPDDVDELIQWSVVQSRRGET
jgi:DNA-binding NtrC family response regulator